MSKIPDDLNNKICDTVTTFVGTDGLLSQDTVYELYKDLKKAGRIDVEQLRDQDHFDPVGLMRDAVWQSMFQLLCEGLEEKGSHE